MTTGTMDNWYDGQPVPRTTKSMYNWYHAIFTLAKLDGTSYPPWQNKMIQIVHSGKTRWCQMFTLAKLDGPSCPSKLSMVPVVWLPDNVHVHLQFCIIDVYLQSNTFYSRMHINLFNLIYIAFYIRHVLVM